MFDAFEALFAAAPCGAGRDCRWVYLRLPSWASLALALSSHVLDWSDWPTELTTQPGHLTAGNIEVLSESR
jgi:hypothetical protein